MTEKLFQYIWQFQYFNRSELQTASGEKLEIIHPGRLNTGQGPDFSNAQLKIDGTLLAGSVELHLRASQWREHGHHHDPNYNNVILHVVFENNEDPTANRPVLELRSRISRLLLDRYAGLMNSPSFIPCSHAIATVNELTWAAWKERLLAERLTRKSALAFDFLKQNNGHWEETFWWMLARNFGMKANAETFEAVARSLPLNLLARHKSLVQQMEALLLGQAGLLGPKFGEEYPQLLWKEYCFLKSKYKLRPVFLPIHFLRMRPGNFPTIRLAQLAVLVQQSAHLFSRVAEAERLEEIMKLFEVTANDYWHYHYRFDEPSPFKKKTVGRDMTVNLIINTITPMLFAYGLYRQEEKYKEKALKWLEQLEGESNTITRGFVKLELKNANAFDSQALLELKTQYCDHRHCLRCAVGNAILRQQ